MQKLAHHRYKASDDENKIEKQHERQKWWRRQRPHTSMYKHARCERTNEQLSQCVFLWFDVRIFSTFYIRTKLDFLLFINCRLCSIHRVSQNAPLSTLFAAIIFPSLSALFSSYSAHLHRHSLTRTHTRTHSVITCSGANYIHIFISISIYILFSFVAAVVVVACVVVVVVIIAFWPSH